jgi:hypothetical protein
MGHILRLKGKLVERRGRKGTGLIGDFLTIAGLPDERF